MSKIQILDNKYTPISSQIEVYFSTFFFFIKSFDEIYTHRQK